MHHARITPAETVSASAIRALISDEAAHLMARTSAVDAQLVTALDREYGEHGWFLFWDEDLRGHPIPGTLTLSFGRETLVIG